MPALQPTLSVPIRGDQPLVQGIAQRAAYLSFDYGPWADVYVSTLTREEAAELLADPARRVHDAGEAELAKRIIGEDDAALRFAVPRPKARHPGASRACDHADRAAESRHRPLRSLFLLFGYQHGRRR